MTKNWVEDLVAEFYRLQGYFVATNLDLPMPKTEYRKVRGHSDIDVLAIKNNEVKHIECQSWWGPAKKNEDKEFRRLKERFDVAQGVLLARYDFLKNLFEKSPKTTRIFVTSGKPEKLPKNRDESPWYRLEKFCENEDIQLVEINTILEETIEKLRKKYPKPDIVGKEESSITRLIIHLIHNDFLEV